MKPPKFKMTELGPIGKENGDNSHAEARRCGDANFKMTELGPIPKDWEVKAVKDIAEIGRGRVISQVEIEKSISKLYPVYSSQTSNDGEMGRIDSYDFDGEYVTWTTDGVNAGRVFYRKGKFNCTNVCGVLKIINESPQYIAIALNMRTCDYVATNLANPKLMNGVMKEIKLPLPPLPEQRRIAGALSDVDELISALGKLIEKKRNIKTGTMQQLLTGKCRLPGFGGAKFKQTDLGPIPEDWEVKRLGEVFSMLRNNTYARDALTDDGGKVFNVHYGDILVKYGAKVNFEMDEVPCLKAGIKPNKDMLQDGDLIFADTAEDEMVGKAVEVSGLKGRQAVAGLHTVLCRPNADTFALGFLGYFINSAIYHNQLLP